MLSEQQKNELLGLIVLFIGNDPSISSSKPYFNNATVDVVERMIKAAELKGYGCQVVTKSKWKPAIITTTY